MKYFLDYCNYYKAKAEKVALKQKAMSPKGANEHLSKKTKASSKVASSLGNLEDEDGGAAEEVGYTYTCAHTSTYILIRVRVLAHIPTHTYTYTY